MRDGKTRSKMSVMVALTSVASMMIGVPAMAAECGAGGIQEVWRIDGVWQGAVGPLVTADPVADGLAWEAATGVALASVQAESFPERVGDAVISSAVTLPGAPSGMIVVFGEVDHRVVFTAVAECRPGLDVHEDPAEAFAGPGSKPEPAAKVEPASASRSEMSQAPEPRQEAPSYRRLTRMMFYPE